MVARIEPYRAVQRCRLCHKRRPCVMGACFDCADKVSGTPIKIRTKSRGVENAHQLWETAKPSNRWRANDSQSNLVIVRPGKPNSAFKIPNS